VEGYYVTYARNRAKEVAFSSIVLALAFVLLYIGNISPADWSFMMLTSFVLYLPYVLADNFLAGIWVVVGVNMLGYLFIPNVFYMLSFTFISMYVPIRWLLRGKKEIIAWALKFLYFNAAFFGWAILLSTVLGIDIISQMARNASRIIPLSQNLLIFGVIIFGNLFFGGYEYVFKKVVWFESKWVSRILGE